MRFDPEVRNRLKELRRKVVTGVRVPSQGRESYLLWGRPGSGKTNLVEQIATSLGPEVEFVTPDVAKLGEDAFRSGIARVTSETRPCRCLVDEVDARAAESWPYEVLVPSLDPPPAPPARKSFVLAGSSASGLAEMKQRMLARPKGADRLSRVPSAHEFSIPPLATEDKIAVVVSELGRAAEEHHRVVREIERLALFYVVSNPQIATPRQLRELAVRSVERLTAGVDRVRCDHLFDPGDAENKEFWLSTRSTHAEPVNSFVSIVDYPKPNSPGDGEDRGVGRLPPTRAPSDPRRPRWTRRDSSPGSSSNASMRARPVVFALLAVGLLAVSAFTLGATTSRAAPLASSTAPAGPQPMTTVALAITHTFAGYAIADAKSVYTIEGNWNVPRVNGSCPSKLEMTFVGISLGGYKTPSAGLIGTETYCYLGHAHYYSFISIGRSGAAGTLAIAPGNRMHAALVYSPLSGYLHTFLQDLTKGTSTTNYGYVFVGKHTDAAWVDEVGYAASTGKMLPLVDFGKVVFSDCLAAVNGTTLHTLGHYSTTAVEMYNKGTTAFKADVSVITPNNKGFSVRWDSAGP
ncbi:MAG: G1 family endopeptidase [Thermoplasmata archaeon]|nr:G1 family endopeptidase [Thermoplasmata archaeon]MCI4356597.1 G1 family endopeptidase [Thermoplasmata archaeon]